RAPMNAGVLTKGVVVDYDNFGGFALVTAVLRFGSERYKLRNPVITSKRCMAIYDDMGSDTRSGSDLDVRTYDGERPPFNVISNLCLGMNPGRGINRHYASSSVFCLLGTAIISARQANSSPTHAS